MNANQLINMAVRIVMRKLLHKGIDAGVDMASRRGHGADPEARPDDPQGRAQANETKKRLRQSMRVVRRMGRF